MENFKKFVLSALESLSAVGFLAIILYSAITGAVAAGFFGFIGGTIIGFVWAVIIFGIIFLLMEINQNLKNKNQL